MQGKTAMITGEPVLPGADGSFKDWVAFLIPLFFFSFSLTVIYQAMRGVLDLGGFVAAGGPYEIAHPAPGWVWVLPVFINVMVISMIASATLGKRIRGPNLMALSWSALFISLGWNFTEYGFRAFGAHAGGIGWLVCALLFMLMGLIPLIVIVFHFLKGERETEAFPDAIPWKGKVLLQAVITACGVWLGIRFFGSLG